MKQVALIFFIVVGFASLTAALTPGDLSRVRFEQHPGQQISRDLVFRDENNRPVKLGDLFGTKPIIFVPGYYRCPMLCTLINDGLINTLENLRGSVGPSFEVVDLSIDPTETVAAAAEKKTLYLRRYGRPGAADGWHCLVGDQKDIAQVCDELGYRAVYDPETKQYAHPSGIVVLTPEGKISRYIFGVTFSAPELNDAIASARQGRSSSVLSKIFLLCYHYNPITGKYGQLILTILRVVSLGFLVLIAWCIYRMARNSSETAAEIG